MPKIGPHGGGEGKELGRGRGITGPREGESEPEMSVVIRRAGLHDYPEARGRLMVPAGIELRPGQSFAHAAGLGFGGRGTLQDLLGGRRAAPAEKIEAT
jgi:hypothetical protein